MKSQADIDFFQESFRQYYPKIVSFVRHYFKDSAQAEDVAQDAFVTFWNNVEKIDKEHTPLPYLYLVAKNKALNVLKQNVVADKFVAYASRRGNELAYKALSSLTMDDVQAKDLKDKILDSVRKMNPNTAETFMLSRFKGMKNAEIAEVQKVSIKTVEYRLASAMTVLREDLKDFLALILFFIIFRV